MEEYIRDNSYINWFPGHMSKTRRMVGESIKLCDVVCEIVDARIPNASRNPMFGQLLGTRPRIVVLNKADLADAEKNKQWLEHYRASGAFCMLCDSKSRTGAQDFARLCKTAGADMLAARQARGVVSRRLRVMVAGVPNVGKSTFINMLAGRAAAASADKPGVTKGKQWITVSRELELLDMPGLLWPKIETERQALLLCFTGAVRDTVVDAEHVAGQLGYVLNCKYRNNLIERYKCDLDDGMTDRQVLEAIGKARGFMRRGGVVDTERAAQILLDEYRGGKLGRLTLEDVGE